MAQIAWRTRTIRSTNPTTPGGERHTVDDPSSGPVAADDDVDVVTRAKQDPVAFAPLYVKYEPIIRGYCQRRLGNPEIAADATSQVFIRALNALPKFLPDSSRPGNTFRSWLFTIAHNTVIDTHRRDRHPLSLDAPGRDGTISPALIDLARSPEEHAITADTRRQVRQTLAKLPETQRQIVELRLAELTGAEIAETLGMSLSAVKSAQFRAYATLRDLLDHPTRPSRLAETETTDASR